MADPKDDKPCRLSLDRESMIIQIYPSYIYYLSKTKYFIEKCENVDGGPGDQEHQGEGAKHDVGPQPPPLGAEADPGKAGSGPPELCVNAGIDGHHSDTGEQELDGDGEPHIDLLHEVGGPGLMTEGGVLKQPLQPGHQKQGEGDDDGEQKGDPRHGPGHH